MSNALFTATHCVQRTTKALMEKPFDLNLLRVFDALMETGSVSQAAVRLHLSAPATSRALGRLRVAMDDPILVRAGQSLVPTPFALRSAPHVKAVLVAAAALPAASTVDEPRDWQRTFLIRLNDGLTPVLAPRLTRLVTADAPAARLQFVAQDTKSPGPLRDGSLDLDIGVLDPPPPDICTSTLFTDRFVAVVAADSELGRAPRLTIDDICTYPHISASRRGLARGPLDDALTQIGRARHVAAVVPSYAVGALMTLERDAICLISNVMTNHLTDRGVPLRSHEIPLPLPTVSVELRWHRRVDQDPASKWLRDRITVAVQPLTAT
jgi:DNA-binding transcriptional LysR family regulator